MRRSLWAVDRSIRDLKSRRYGGIHIDEGFPPNGDGFKSKVAISFNTESSKSRSIQVAAVPKCDQVTFVKPCRVMDIYILPNPGSKEAIIKNGQRRM